MGLLSVTVGSFLLDVDGISSGSGGIILSTVSVKISVSCVGTCEDGDSSNDGGCPSSSSGSGSGSGSSVGGCWFTNGGLGGISASESSGGI